MTISEKDALTMHAAIHNGKASSVKLSSGETLPVETASNKCRVVNVDGIKVMEQNKKKSSEWAKKAIAGAKITWILSGNSPSSWGRIVDGNIEADGKAIISSGGKTKAKAKATEPVPAKKAAPPPKKKTASEAAEPPPAKKAKADPAAPSPAGTASSSADPLRLAPLFAGSGHGAQWEAIIRPVIESQLNAAEFIGPTRNKAIVPVRELTFQALKPNPPGGWRVVSFGQSPYPRIESATGIAHFDNALSKWSDSRFGSIVTMRCIIKCAAMHKFGIAKATSVDDIRALLEKNSCVGPAEWFQAMLTQGVLFMNAACTLKKPDKGERAGTAITEHSKFWQPVVEAIVDAILTSCKEHGKGIVFAWWGSESLKTKKVLDKGVFQRHPGVKVVHLEHYNPAAMADAFCDDPNHFKAINTSLSKLGLEQIDWLPSIGWKSGLSGKSADKMGDFIAQTQELHKMYLERLKDGLDDRKDELADITGIAAKPLVPLKNACKPLKLGKPAEVSVEKAKAMPQDQLTVEEAAAVHLYTTNYLYKMLNEALRSKDRKKVQDYFLYLRLLLSALEKMTATTKKLYRGVALDLKDQYKVGSEVTWWAVSSCTPDLKVASSFSGGSKSTLFIIMAMTAVGIREFSEFKAEEEFVLGPGTQFAVKKVEVKGKQIEIHMSQLDRDSRVR